MPTLLATPTHVVAPVATKVSSADATLTNLNIPVPAECKNGHFILLIVSASANGASIDPTVNPPAGFNVIESLNDPGGTNSSKLSLFWKWANNEAGNWTVQFSGATGVHIIGVPVILRNVDPTTPFDVESGLLLQAASATARPTKSITTDKKAMIVEAYADKSVSTYIMQGGTELIDTTQGGWASLGIGVEEVAAGTFSRTATASVATSVGVSGIVAVYGRSTAMPLIDTLIGTTPFYVAHRGGSVDYVECTQAAFDAAIALGAKAIETPMYRTTDGVWVLSHDQSTLRMTGTDLDIPTSAWAAISPLRTTSGNHALMRFDDFLARYKDMNIVMFLDNKIVAAPEEWFDMIDAAVGPAKAVIKNHFSSVGISTRSKNRGYWTWGYYYDADVATDLATTHTRWDMLGLDYGATQASYDTMLALGKKVITHVCLTAANVTTGLGKGAHGAMTGKLIGVLPAQAQTKWKPTRTDTIFSELVGLGHTVGSILDRERKRLLAKLGLTEPQNKSLQDLYRDANERPRL